MKSQKATTHSVKIRTFDVKDFVSGIIFIFKVLQEYLLVWSYCRLITDSRRGWALCGIYPGKSVLR